MPDPSVAPAAASHRRALAIGFLFLVLAVYLPVILHGGFIWDDPQYITQNPTLRSLAGLWDIWAHPRTIPQYYPLVHSSLWIEYHLWGLHPLGYHLDNVLLHGVAAVLLWRVLVRLGVAAAPLAALVFALHPVNVESVAWATERKNVLSLVFYLLALHSYLDLTGPGCRIKKFSARPYLASLGFFVAALLSKSVTCSLPAAILLLIFWKNGNLRRRDWVPLLPFFALGLVMAMVTSGLEARHVGASGREWPWTFGQRILIAGRALWFYAAKLLWPLDLTFIYPKWTDMSFARPWLVLFPLSFLGTVAALWLLMRRLGRGPLVAVLLFAGTLLPALGFVNLFPMRYSFVADHFQYQACIALIVLFSSLLWKKSAGRVVGFALLIPLAVLSWQQQAIYHDATTLWQDTLKKNPNSWMAWGNLGDEYAASSNQPDISAAARDELRAKARHCYEQLNLLAPDQAITHLKWGIVKEYDGDWEAARSEFAAALDQQPDFTPAMNSMGLALMKLNQPDQAIDFYRRAVAADPGYAEARYNLGVALEQRGDVDGAMVQYQLAVQRRPDLADAAYNLANLLLVHVHQAGAAAEYYAMAVGARPDRPDYRVNYALALRALGRLDEARAQCDAALALHPDFSPALKLRASLGR